MARERKIDLSSKVQTNILKTIQRLQSALERKMIHSESTCLVKSTSFKPSDLFFPCLDSV